MLFKNWKLRGHPRDFTVSLYKGGIGTGGDVKTVHQQVKLTRFIWTGNPAEAAW